MTDYTDHQFSLFGFQKPVGKVPISAARIQEAKDAIASNNAKSALSALRDVRYKLQAFEKRINQKTDDKRRSN
jgi:hypothetical protein